MKVDFKGTNVGEELGEGLDDDDDGEWGEEGFLISKI